MQTRYKSFLLSMGFLASAYAGHHAILWGQSIVMDTRKRIMCTELGERLLTYKPENSSSSKKTTLQYSQVVQFIDHECWAGKR